MTLINNALYVADTENHLLRRLDLATKRVTTIAGTGEKGMARPQATGEGSPKPGDNKTEVSNTLTAISLSSPWALCLHENDLYIAMAGMHQIWRMPIDGSRIAPYAGNGRENVADGPLLPKVPYDQSFASFAQPSGLTTDGGQLFVADSEGSTVRAVPFDPKGTVKTLVGLTNTLFDFGDIDGSGQTVRLQHPLDVVWVGGKLYVADTYNNKIKVIDPRQRSCRTIAGTGKVGKSDAERGLEGTFNESGGISAANGRLYVADTNNHAIRVVELAPPNRVTTLTIEGLKAPGKK
jgi:DNA-binding beta-propeller fold protein YncE